MPFTNSSALNCDTIPIDDTLRHSDLRFMENLFLFLFYLYIYPPDSQENDGGANT